MQGTKRCADNDSDIYDRWSQALASSRDLAFDSVYKKPPPQSLAFVMPLVIVPNNSLWTASYNEHGLLSEEPKRVDQCEFYVDHKIGIGLPFVLTHIHFMTLVGLADMMSSFVVSHGRIWETIFSRASSEYHW
jgi:hypothetical protein